MAPDAIATVLIAAATARTTHRYECFPPDKLEFLLDA